MPDAPAAMPEASMKQMESSEKKGPVLSDLLSEEGFSVAHPHSRHVHAGRRLRGVSGAFSPDASRIQAGIPSLMQILEIIDTHDKPLMCMPPDSVIRQKLHRRVVCVALYSRRKTLYLHKRMEPMLDFQGLWDLYSGAVLLGEAREDAALRLLRAKTGLAQPSLTEAARRPGDREQPSHLTLFTARLPIGVSPVKERYETMQVDADELEGLAAHAPELLTPSLLWAAQDGHLFKK